MADYERPSFKKEWWDEVKEYLKGNPEEGFSDDEVKQFIKFATTRYMNQDTKDLKILKQKLDEKLEELED